MTDDEVIDFLAGTGRPDGSRWTGLLSLAAEFGPEVLRADIEITDHAHDRRLSALGILAPHLRAGASTWASALAALSVGERAEVERLISMTMPDDRPARPLSPQDGENLEALAHYMRLFELAMRRLPPVLDLIAMEPASRSEATRDAVMVVIDEVAREHGTDLDAHERERFRTQLIALIDQLQQESEARTVDDEPEH